MRGQYSQRRKVAPTLDASRRTGFHWQPIFLVSASNKGGCTIISLMDAPSIRDLIPDDHIWEQMAGVENRLLEATESEDAFLTKIAQHLLVAGGKRFRPLLAQLAAEFGPSRDSRRIEAGVAVELIHVGSLYHDDVMDEAMTRRGEASGNALWGDSMAIMAGDYLLARASQVAATHLGLESVLLLATTYARLVEGQTLELQLDYDLDHSADEYYRVIGGKTASLISAAARLGALAADAAPEVTDALSTWAWELGIVFQITDDALDLVADDEFLGKPAGSDILEGKITLPVLYALEGPDGDRIRQLLGPAPFTADSAAEVIKLVRSGGHVDRSLTEAAQRIEAAESAIAGLPDNDAHRMLSRMGVFLLDQVEAARAT